MAYEASGKIVAIYDETQRSATFKTREFAIEVNEETNGRVFTSYVKFQTTQDRTAILDKVKVGEDVKVHFNLRGSKWEKDGRTNYITNLDAWRIEAGLAGAAPAAAPQQSNSYASAPAASTDSETTADDLPF